MEVTSGIFNATASIYKNNKGSILRTIIYTIVHYVIDISGLDTNEEYIIECHGKSSEGYVSEPKMTTFKPYEEIYVEIKNTSGENYIKFTKSGNTNDLEHSGWLLKGKKYKFIVK